MTPSADVSRRARALIAGRLGLDFPEGRQADLEQGLLRACRASPASTPEAYLGWLETLPDGNPEWRRLAGQLTVGETYFFRDRATFDVLEQDVLPSLVTARRAEGARRLRLWSAGCATGEEPYSLAILVDRLLPDLGDWTLTILATDINPVALETAARGIYREWSFRETPAWIRERYFRRRGARTFEVDPRIRRMVTVAPLNLAEDGYPGVVTNTSAMDLVLCRNVLMYFTRDARQATVGRLKRALLTGGWLVVSPAEGSADLFRPLVPVGFSGAVFYRKEPLSAAAGPPRWPSWPVETVAPEPPGPFANTSGDLVRSPSPTGSAETRAGTSPTIPSTIDDLERARALADQGDLDRGRELCDAALTRNRLDPDAYLLLAAICQERGEIPAALDALRRVLYLAPDSAPAHFLLGSLLRRQGEHRRGRRHMETVVSLLSPVPRDDAVPGGDGLTAGRLLETARAYLEVRR